MGNNDGGKGTSTAISTSIEASSNNSTGGNTNSTDELDDLKSAKSILPKGNIIDQLRQKVRMEAAKTLREKYEADEAVKKQRLNSGAALSVKSGMAASSSLVSVASSSSQPESDSQSATGGEGKVSSVDHEGEGEGEEGEGDGEGEGEADVVGDSHLEQEHGQDEAHDQDDADEDDFDDRSDKSSLGEGGKGAAVDPEHQK